MPANMCSVNVQAPLPQMGADRGSSPLLAAATSLDLPPCSHAILGGGEGSAFHAVGSDLLLHIGTILARCPPCIFASAADKRCGLPLLEAPHQLLSANQVQVYP